MALALVLLQNIEVITKNCMDAALMQILSSLEILVTRITVLVESLSVLQRGYP